jgi:predicted amidohydrolase YtcJ
MQVFEGTIIVGDAAATRARFLVEDKGRVAFVGNELPAAYRAAPRTGLSGGALLPALWDTHVHFMSHALFASGLDVRAAVDLADLRERVRAYCARPAAGTVIGFGASAWSLAERRMPDKADLDAAAGAKPVFLVKYDGHAAVANSALLARLPRAVAGKRGYDEASGYLEADAFFAATDFVTGSVPLPAVLAGMLRAADAAAARGVGGLHSVSGVGFPLDLDVTVESLFGRGRRGGQQYRIYFQTWDVKKALRRGFPRIGGCFACALDGSFGSADAALNQPYADAPDQRGILYRSDAEVAAYCREANRAGLQIQLHAIGDAAFDQATSALDAALRDFPRAGHRHTVIHACLPTDRGLDICAERGIVLAMQPAFLDWPQEPVEYLERKLGDRVRRLNPLASLLRRGIVVTGGSDAPCTPLDPWLGMAAAIGHPDPAERLGFDQALALYARSAAYGSFDEADRGSLEAGKVADFIRLDADPSGFPPRELAAVRPAGLYLAGRRFEAGQNRADLLARGLFAGRRVKI